MTDTTTEGADETDSKARWPLVSLGGVVSLCCLFATPAATGAVGTTVAGGTTAALGGGLVRIVVSAVTVGVIGVFLQRWAGSPSCKR